MSSASPRFDHFVGEATGCLFGVSRRSLDVRRRLWRRFERNQLDVEHEHAFRIAHTFVSERFRNPETSRFTSDHQLHAFRPSANHAIERERCRHAAADLRAIEHFSVGRPAGVMDGDHIAFGRVRFACSRLDDSRRQTAGRFGGSGRRSGDVRWCWNCALHVGGGCECDEGADERRQTDRADVSHAFILAFLIRRRVTSAGGCRRFSAFGRRVARASA